LYQSYCTAAFIPTDPIRVPHRFTVESDREIMGFLAAMLAFGSRSQFLPKLDTLCDAITAAADSPTAFIRQYDILPPSLQDFTYRFFTAANLRDILQFLHVVYCDRGGLRPIAVAGYRRTGDALGALEDLREAFLQSGPLDPRSVTFLGDPRTSACKKANMFLRWMVRRDAVDFGLWSEIPPSALYLPLDTHSFRTSRRLGLTARRTCSFRAVVEITRTLAELDPTDPVKYDFALYGSGAFT